MPALRPRELKRLEKELQDIKSLAKDSPVSAEALDDITHWKGKCKGPEGTDYEGGVFTIDIQIPEDYPYNPPKMKFDTKIWHPNISSQTGAICLDVLGKEWSPALTIRTALLSIQALLSAPEPSDPQDAEVATQFKTNRALFSSTAKFWTESYAMERSVGDPAKVTQLAEMLGKDEDTIRTLLEKHNWDETAVVNAVFG
eukprot:TRINITY_DN37906_c0_g1_i1.p1 TRINITY_DN37906_c0_g1~~TRINITY_DN37906_c0_g1_i1.p1  ORF type:complete len:199 (-),score=55.38 TRINITY_DN37906_c0_g1_i1:95-691(-)